MYGTGELVKVQVLPDAARYIIDHGGHVFIRPSPRHGCCGGTAYPPVIDVGHPHATDDYQSVLSEGITVYLHKGFSRSDAITIGMNRLGRWKKLWVDGCEILM